MGPALKVGRSLRSVSFVCSAGGVEKAPERPGEGPVQSRTTWSDLPCVGRGGPRRVGLGGAGCQGKVTGVGKLCGGGGGRNEDLGERSPHGVTSMAG